MSIRALQAAFSIIAETPELRPSATITLLVLANCHNQETGRCDPAISTIAKKGALSERSVQNGLQQLAELKLVSITYRQVKTGRGKRNMTSRYRIRGGAKFASGVVQDLHPNLKYTRPSAFDDLAMLIDGGESDA